MITLSADDALFLRIPQGRVSEKAVLNAINKCYTLYTDTRFAPENRDGNLERVQEIAARLGITPIPFVRSHHFYCGNGYLPDTASVGSLAYCHSRGGARK